MSATYVVAPRVVKCGACMYWNGASADGVGECRRHAPRPSESYRLQWPVTNSADFCGDGAARDPRTVEFVEVAK